ncbi:MAG: Ig-like domain-containing protein, partial [Bacteroidales bacterium]
MKISNIVLVLIFFGFLSIIGCKKDPPVNTNPLQLISAKAGSNLFSVYDTARNIAANSDIIITFSAAIDTNSVPDHLTVNDSENNVVALDFNYSLDQTVVVVHPNQPFSDFAFYTLKIGDGIKGKLNETFAGASFVFITEPGKLAIEEITLNQDNFNPPAELKNVRLDTVRIVVRFSQELDPSNYAAYFQMDGYSPVSTHLSADRKTVTTLNANALNGWTKYLFSVSSDLKAANGNTFNGFSNSFYTTVDSTFKFQLISDTELLDLIEEQTFNYFYADAHPASGMARERNTSGDVVTSGGSGFGMMVLIVGMERGFITREEGLTHLDKMVSFLETCD